MRSRAHTRINLQANGVDLAVTRDDGRTVLLWDKTRKAMTMDPAAEAPPEAWLTLHDEDARAIYDALADHFGHNGHDMRALRLDYMSERARVDKFIAHLMGGAS